MARMRHVLMILGSYDQSAHEGIADYAGEHGWHLNVSILKDFHLPRHWHGDGIITSLNNSRDLEHFVRRARVPKVDLSIWREDLRMPRVVADNAAIGRLGAQHFIEMGHSHCAWFGLASNPVSRTRFAAYSEALRVAGLECIRLDTQRPQDGAFITEKLKKLPKPCGIYTKSDYDSAWIASLCLSAGIRIPEAIAILGADDNPLICERQVVPLSSVRYDFRKIGYAGAALLDGMMQGESVPDDYLERVAPDGITVRQSTNLLAVKDALVREVLEFLEKAFRRPIGTPEVAEAFGVHRRQLEMRFRASMRCSLRERLIHIRLREAKRMLRETGDSVETIAAWCGFCHASHLSNTFRHHFKVTPTAYRKRQQADA